MPRSEDYIVLCAFPLLTVSERSVSAFAADCLCVFRDNPRRGGSNIAIKPNKCGSRYKYLEKEEKETSIKVVCGN